MNKKQFLEVVKRYEEGSATEEEIVFLQAYYRLFDLEPDILNEKTVEEKEQIEARIERRLIKNIGTKATRRGRGIYRWAAAAAIICIAMGYYFLRTAKLDYQNLVQLQGDVKAGPKRSILTLADGRKIILSASSHGKLAQQGGTAVSISARGTLNYSMQAPAEGKMLYNTLTTSRGQQSPFPLILPDGTKVWLDAASSITFPVAFNAKNRKVTVTGQAYFEVVHREGNPFQVAAKDIMLEDIGTVFNVSAYDDEAAISTTLLAGKISVSKGSLRQALKPGQEALATYGIETIKVRDADVNEVVAWKEGYFSFNEDLRSVMRKLARWYDIDVVFQTNNDKPVYFEGNISRQKNISTILKIMESTQSVHFKVEGRRVTVMK